MHNYLKVFKRYKTEWQVIVKYLRKVGFGILFLVVASSIISGITAPLQLFILSVIVDLFDLNQSILYNLQTVIPWIFIFTLVRIIGNFIMNWGVLLRKRFENKLTQHLQMDIFTKSTTMDYLSFETQELYDNLHRANSGMSRIFAGIIFQLFSLVENTAKIIGFIYIIYQANMIIPMILLLSGIPLYFLRNKFNYDSYSLVYSQTSTIRLMNYIVTLLSSREPAKEIRIHRSSAYLINKWHGIYEKLRKDTHKQSIKQRLILGIVESIHVLTLGGSLYLLFLSIQSNSITIGTFIVVIYAIISMQTDWEWTIKYLGWLHEDYLRFAKDLISFLKNDSKKLPLKESLDRGDVERQGVTLTNVNFKYPNASKFSVKNINLAIKPGEKIVLLGANGSGKSTLAKIIIGLLPPTSGELSRSNSFKLTDTTAVFQDYWNYHLSLRENIGISNYKEINNDELIRASAIKGGVSDFLDKLNNNLDSILGPTFGGIDLSGGEWQKVAIARGYLKSSTLTVLDEPTASLDSISEKNLYDKFNKMAEDTTAVLISHRLGMARLADRIIIMDKGKILEMGTHDDLLQLDGRYAKLLNLQKKYYS